MTATPHDYHNTLAELNDPQSDVRRSPLAPGQMMLHRESERDLAAFERGRQQGELEAVRRLEAEGHLGNKTFINNDQTTIINAQLTTANVVEIEHLTWLQRLAAAFGEICSIGYIVIMAYWIDQYRGGVDDWSNSRGSGSVQQFNIHVLASFVGLFAASQAYLDYRILPLATKPLLNKALYIGWHILAMASFGITIAAAILSQPGSHMRSMHAWTAMLAAFVYATHAIYSILKVLFTHDAGIDAHRWNESVNIAEAPSAHNMHLSPEQRRDHNLQLPTLYRAAPSMLHRSAATQYNADGSVNHAAATTGSSAAPVWSESPSYTANNFFLVPRAKWAVTSLIGLLAATLIGLGELQVLLASNASPWANGAATTDVGANTDGDGIDLNNENILIGVIGLSTLAGVMAMAYAAMPPRTVVAKGNFGQVPVNSIAAGTARNSVSIQPTVPIERQREMEVV